MKALWNRCGPAGVAQGTMLTLTAYKYRYSTSWQSLAMGMERKGSARHVRSDGNIRQAKQASLRTFPSYPRVKASNRWKRQA